MTNHAELVELYGLRIRSELPLHQERPVPDGHPPEVTIRMGTPMASTEGRPSGRLVADLESDRRFYTAVQSADGGYVVRFHRTCDFVIDPSLSDVLVRMVHDADPGLAGVLAAGTLLSILLSLRGHPVLHASAVQIAGVAVAFVGASGMGKSTMATLLCAEGAKLITDDVLRLDLDSDAAPRCHLGATEARLRKAAGELSSRFADRPGRRTTSDERDAIRLPTCTTPALPLAGIVIPLADHTGDRASAAITRLSPTDALLTMLRYPRVLGWRDKQILDVQFQHLGRIVDRVPVHLGNLPWGPPFPDGLAHQVLDGMRLSGRALDVTPLRRSA